MKSFISLEEAINILRENVKPLEDLSFEELKDNFFLDPYFDDDNNPINLYGLTRKERGVRFLNQKKESYLEFVDKYVKKSEEIIAFRGQKMVEELKKVL